MRNPKEVEKLSQGEVMLRTEYLKKHIDVICDNFCYAMRTLVLMSVEQARFQPEVQRDIPVFTPDVFLSELRKRYDFWAKRVFEGSDEAPIEAKEIFSSLNSIADIIERALSSKDIEKCKKRGSIFFSSEERERGVRKYNNIISENPRLFNQFVALFNYELSNALERDEDINSRNVLECIEATRNTPCKSINEEEGSLRGYIIASRLNCGQEAYEIIIRHFLVVESELENLTAGDFTGEVYCGLSKVSLSKLTV